MAGQDQGIQWYGALDNHGLSEDMAETEAPLVIRLRIYGAILLTAIGMYWVGQCHGAASAADLLVTQQARSVLAAGKAYRTRLDSLHRIEQQQVSFAQAWKHQADSLRARAVRVDTVVTSDSGALTLWRATANASREEASQCGLALGSCQERAQTAEARAQVLDSLLGGVLKVKDCHIAFIRCPSRTATGLLGLGLGFVGGLLVTR